MIDLVRQQEELQTQAGALADDLRLDELLNTAGQPVRVGSAALGLMVRRDLDVTVVCERLDTAMREAVVGIGAELTAHERVWRVTFRNDTGGWNTDPSYPDGLYLGVGYQALDGQRWTLDLWFVDEPDRQPDLEHLRTLPGRLTDETRNAILAVKQAWAGKPGYGSYDVYRSVLDDGVRTPEDYGAWLSRRATPAE